MISKILIITSLSSAIFTIAFALPQQRVNRFVPSEFAHPDVFFNEFGERAQCPEAALLAPCTCSTSGSDVNVDCSLVTSSVQLTDIFASKPFPMDYMNKLEIIGNSAITSLGNDFLNGASFRVINITKNSALTTVHETVFRGNSAVYLQTLDLSKNAITALPMLDGLDSFVNLAYLDVGENKLTGTIKRFPCPSTLRTLWMHLNQLDAIDPFAFANCVNVELVGVGGNSFTFIPRNAFADLPRVEIIAVNVSPNLGTIQSDAFPLVSENFAELRLRGNEKLTLIEADAITGETCNAKIQLDECGLSILTEEAFRPMLETFSLPQCGGYLDVTGCPIRCTCDMAWLLTDPGLKIHVRGQCQQDGVDIVDQDEDEWIVGCEGKENTTIL